MIKKNLNQGKTIKRIISNYLFPHKIKIFLALLMMIVSAGATGLHAWLVRPALDNVLIEGNKDIVLDLSRLSKGIYIIHIDDGKNTYSYKLYKTI